METPFLFAIAMVGLLTVKFFGLVRLFGVPMNISASVALLLTQRGEFSLVLFALADGIGLLLQHIFQQLRLIALSMLVTPALEFSAYRNCLSSRQSDSPL